MVGAEDLSSDDRERLVARFGRRFSLGETLFREGDLAPEAFLLQDGRVRLSKKVRTSERSLLVLRAGDFFGETGLLENGVRTSTAIALADGIALALDRKTFEQLTERYPAISGRLVEQLILRLADAEDQVEIMTLQDPPSRVVGALLKLAAAVSQGPQPYPHAVLALSPVELSARVGLDVDAVKRVVIKLREQRYLQISSEQIEIFDVEALRRYYALLGAQEKLLTG
jgi:CRP/FNR family transcriptional regulator, cyclic AMP receptor protein